MISAPRPCGGDKVKFLFSEKFDDFHRFKNFNFGFKLEFRVFDDAF